MNRDQLRGAAKNDGEGKGLQKVGKVTGSRTQQAKSAAKQMKGELWKETGTLEQALDKIDRKAR